MNFSETDAINRPPLNTENAVTIQSIKPLTTGAIPTSDRDSAAEFDWLILPIPKEAARQNRAYITAILLQFKPLSI